MNSGHLSMIAGVDPILAAGPKRTVMSFAPFVKDITVRFGR